MATRLAVTSDGRPPDAFADAPTVRSLLFTLARNCSCPLFVLSVTSPPYRDETQLLGTNARLSAAALDSGSHAGFRRFWMPKKVRPFHSVPVMKRAMADKLL